MQSTVIPAVVSQHAEEAAFLWAQRDAAVKTPHYALKDLVRLDARLDAHVDGLRANGEPAWEEIKAAAEGGDPGGVFAAAVVAIEGGTSARISMAIKAGATQPPATRGLVSALGWLPYHQVRSLIGELWASESVTLRHTGLANSSLLYRIGLAATAIQRADPGPALDAVIASEDEDLRARALRAIAELGRVDLVLRAERQLKAEHPAVRFSAAWSTAVLSSKPEALSALATIAQSDSEHRERALETVMRRAELGAGKGWLRRLQQDSATRRLAIQGVGAIGDPAEIPWLIEQMQGPELARIAGESFTTITGVDISYQDLEGERPAGFESGPTEDPADENVEMDPDENLPWPGPKLIQKWWQSNRHSFQPGTRYLIGKPITIDWCKQVLRIGRQRQRAAAALELAMRQPGTPLFEVRAPGSRQKQILGL